MNAQITDTTAKQFNATSCTKLAEQSLVATVFTQMLAKAVLKKQGLLAKWVLLKELMQLNV